MTLSRWNKVSLVAGATAAVLVAGVATPAFALSPTDPDSALSAFNAAMWQVPDATHGPGWYATTQRTSRGAWEIGSDFQTLLDAYERTGASAYRAQIDQAYTFVQAYYTDKWENAYADAGPMPGYKNEFDDIMWMTMPYVRAYQLTNESKFLTQAEYEWGYVYDNGWTSDLGGGLTWHLGWGAKSANTNGGTAIAGFGLYDATGDNSYETKSLAITDWMIGHLFNASTGEVYNDQVISSGAQESSPWSYNWGVFIGALNAAYKHTGNATYLTDAKKALDYVIANLTLPSGVLKDETFNNNSMEFKQDLVRFAGRLINDNDLTSYVPWLQINANAAWSNRRTGDNLTYTAWGSPAPSGTISNAAAMPALAVMTTVPSDGVNVAPQATATASSVFNSSFPASNVTDNNIGTSTGEWAEDGAHDPNGLNPTIRLTWTTAQNLDKIVLFDRINSDNVNAGTLKFSDGSSINVSAISTGGTGKSIAFTPRNVTWVEFDVTGGAGLNVGLSEFQAYAENDLAAGKTAAVSSTYDTSGNFAATNALDSNTDTRWSSAGTTSNTETYQVDLGSTQSLNTVEIDWEAAYASAYSIATSTDGVSYTTVSNRSGIIEAGPTADRFATIQARYVKVTMTSGFQPTWRNFSFWSLKVFNLS